jgi:hypothetical protein
LDRTGYCGCYSPHPWGSPLGGNVVELTTDAPISVPPPTGEVRWGRSKRSGDSSFISPIPAFPRGWEVAESIRSEPDQNIKDTVIPCKRADQSILTSKIPVAETRARTVAARAKARSDTGNMDRGCALFGTVTVARLWYVPQRVRHMPQL